MLTGLTDGMPELSSQKDPLLSDPTSSINEDEISDISEQILYTASFEELANNNLQYDTVIWVSISLVLVLAWGAGIIMLLYLPYRRYFLRKDILSRKLYVTSNEIVYKVSRPSFVPFWGVTTIEKQIPLSLVIDIIIEQGCLQSVYGIHTFRVESVAHGKAAPVDELLVQGVSNPGYLRKVIIAEASKLSNFGRHGKPVPHTCEGFITPSGSFTERPTVLRSPSKTLKMTSSPRYASVERTLPGDLLLNKLEEVNKSVKKIELLVEKAQASPGRI